jgi:hypothetical protein
MSTDPRECGAKLVLPIQEDSIMYFDETIAAGLIVIGGTIAFLGGFAWFAYKDSQKSKQVKVKSNA